MMQRACCVLSRAARCRGGPCALRALLSCLLVCFVMGVGLLNLLNLRAQRELWSDEFHV